MPPTKYLKGECSQCHGHIEFPVESAGMTIDCPHCGKTTELLLATPPEEPLLPTRTIVWTVVVIVIAAIGVAGMLIPLNMAQKKVARQKEEVASKAAAAASDTPPAVISDDPATKAGFGLGAITLEKTPGSSLTYAVGTLVNMTNRQRFGVRIELDLLDGEGKKIGSAKDYQQLIEPKGQWQFKALCVDSKAKSAKLALIQEDQ